MNKIVLDVNSVENKKTGSIPVFNAEKMSFDLISYVEYNIKLYEENKKLKAEIESIKKDFSEFKKAVNEKLESYHSVLQILTKE